MSNFDVKQAVRAYEAWDGALRSGDLRAQDRAEFFLRKLAHREGITRAQLLSIVQESAGITIN